MAEEYEIIVVGGGIAGLTAGKTAAAAGRRTMILIGRALGGHLVTIEKIDGLPDHPDGVAGYELCPTVQMAAAEAGAAFAMEEADTLSRDGEGWRLNAAGKNYGAKAVILATGTTFKTLGVPGEDRLAGRGVSQCASCDAPLMRGKPVVVVGGGDSALQEALTLLPHVSRLTLVVDGDDWTGEVVYGDPLVADPKVELRTNTVVAEILGDEGVTGVRLKEAGGGTVDVEAHGVFVFIGLEGCSQLVEGLVTPDGTGRLPVDDAMRTELPGLFAAGTIRADTVGRAAEVARDGEIAANAANRYVADGIWPRN